MYNKNNEKRTKKNPLRRGKKVRKKMQFTEEDYNNFPVIDGYKQCPSGDYSRLKFFHKCIFGNNCVFRRFSNFSCGCKFGENCVFGDYCHFGYRCTFSKHCTFGEKCVFLKNCKISENCFFGERCIFYNEVI